MTEPQRDRDAERLTEDIATRVTAKLIERAEAMGFDFLTRSGRDQARADFEFLRRLRETRDNRWVDINKNIVGAGFLIVVGVIATLLGMWIKAHVS